MQLKRALIEPLELRQLLTVSIQFDYSLDSSGFFNDATRRNVIDAAANVLETRLGDTLSAITPGGSNSWSLSLTNPSTGSTQNISNPSIPADTIIVYVGSRQFSGATLAAGGPAGNQASGSTAWVNLVRARGESGAQPAAAQQTDVAPAAGAIGFDSDTNWFSGLTTSGISGSQADLYSVTMHELGHVLGIGLANSWKNLIISEKFTGSASEAVYGGPVPVTSDGGHWASGTSVGGVEASMDPAIALGARKSFTALDFAGLDDIGWEVSSTAPQVGTITQLTLLNTNTNQSAGALTNGQTINSAAFPFSVRAETTGNIGSVIFVDNGVTIRTENTGPYDIAGDNGNSAIPWSPAPGAHTLKVTPYAGANGSGAVGTPITISFTVTQPQPSTAVTALTLINASTGQAAGAIANGQTINLATFPISVRADTSGNVGSVVFRENGNVIHSESVAPYSINGDSNGTYTPWVPSVGQHTLTVTPYSGSGGSGTAGTALTVTFTISNSGTSTPTTIRVNAGGGAYTSTAGKVFSADSGFVGGTTSTASFAVGGTDDDPMFSSRRFGQDFTYSANVTNGNYTLYLNFAEPYWTAAGKRVFDVFAENQLIVNDLDLVARAGAKNAYTVSVNVKVTDGQLNLRFLASVDQAIISSIALLPA